MQVAVCDDEKVIVKQVKEYLESLQNLLEHRISVKSYYEAGDLLYDIEEGVPYAIVIIDIEMGSINGIDAAGKIKELSPETKILFMTGHDQYVYDTFRADPSGFIKKPITLEKLKGEFLRVANNCDDLPVLEYRTRKGLCRTFLKRIRYLMSDKRKIIVVHTGGEDSYYGKLDEVEKELIEKSNLFIRISQSIIINTNYIAKINAEHVEMSRNDDTERFQIGQKYKSQVRAMYMTMISEEGKR